MRKKHLVLVAITAVVAIITLYGRTNLWTHKLELKAYFQDAQGLRVGAPVRLAGVDVGSVTAVRARPDLRESPAEIVLLVSTPYELKIPSDSSVSLATAGVLGETFVQIEVEGASGPPAASGAVVKARPTQTVGTKELLGQLGKVIKPCDGQKGDVAQTDRAKGDGEKKSPR